MRGARGQADLEASGRGRVRPQLDPRRLLAELDDRLAHHAVAPTRRERQAGAAGLRLSRRSLAAGHQAADGEHGHEVGGQPQVQRQPHLPAAVVGHDQPLRQEAGRADDALPAHGERSLSVGQLVERRRPERVGSLEQLQGLAVDQQLVAGQEPAVAIPEAERVRLVRPQAAVARGDQEDVVALDDQRVGQIQLHAWCPCARSERSRLHVIPFSLTPSPVWASFHGPRRRMRWPT